MQKQPAASQQLVEQQRSVAETSQAIRQAINPFRLAGVSAYREYFTDLLTPPAKIVPAATGEVLQVLGDELVLKLVATDTAGRLTLLEHMAVPGSGIPLHVHTQEDEFLLVIAGRLEVFIGGAMHTLEAGNAALMPRNVPHAFRVLSETCARLLVFMTPGGLDGMFQELAQLATGQPDKSQTASICGRYGISFL